MDLRQWVAERAVRRARVLLVETPGGWAARVAMERAVRDEDWSFATSPAGADVLAVCGPVAHAYAEPLDALWDQLPGPRARMDVTDPQGVHAALEDARNRLLDADAQARDARERTQDVRDREQEGMDHEGMDHDGMDHGSMDMAPDGIALAEGAPDRDGLELDVLHLTLGPGLVHWPAGLVVTCTLHGDVVAEADGEWLPPDGPASRPAEPLRRAAWRADTVASVLALAGWDDGLARAQGVRDLLLDAQGRGESEAGEAERRACADLARRVRRSRLLRRSLRHVQPRPADGINDGGDAYDLLLATLDRFETLVDGSGDPDPPRRPDAPAVATAVVGHDVATVRLVVACLDLDPEPAPEVARG